MSDIEKYGNSSQGHSPVNASTSKGSEKDIHITTSYTSREQLLEGLKGQEVARDLKPRHISMIAIGGTIGTGLFISTGNTLAQAGPVSTLISYLFMASLAISVVQALGEMATYIPVSGSFTQFSARWLSPALGAANGYSYWFSWAITFALELSIIGQVIQFWTDKVPLGAWIGIFFVILLASNMFPVKYYGEIEFWVASIKVIAVVGFLIYALVMVCGGGKTGPVGFRYWRNPGPWGPGVLVHSNMNTARFLGWLSSLISAAFAYQGCELIGISTGEMQNPKGLPKAIRSIYIRILLFFILSILFIGMLVPYNDPKLSYNLPTDSDASYAATSPFIIAMQNSGTKVLPDIFNAVLVATIISAGNSNVYCGSRILYGLSQAGVAPKFFGWTTKQGVPYVTVIITALFGLLAFLVLDHNGNTVFTWLLNITAVAGLISWGGIAVTHLRFMSILKSRGISRDSLPYKAAFQPYLSWYAFITVTILVFIQGFSAFFNFTASDFFTAYISVLFFAVMWVFFHFFFNGFTKKAFSMEGFLNPIDECDIDTGVREIDEYYTEPPPKNLWEKFWNLVT